MIDAGGPPKGRSRKRKRPDYTAIANQQAVSLQEHDLVSQIRRHESLDSYARLQSLISGMLDQLSVLIKLNLCLDKDSSFSVVPSEHIASQHPTDSYPTTYDVDDLVFDAPNIHYNMPKSLSLPSWREIGLPGHEHHSLDDADDLVGSLGDLDHPLTDTLEDDMAYEDDSHEDDSEEILERLQAYASEQLSGEDDTRNTIGKITSLYVSSFHLALE